MKYQKKPIPIEAYHLGREEEPDWYKDAKRRRLVKKAEGGVYIKTLEGTMYGPDGCYIIKGVAGELYPCKESVFEDTYDKIDS